MKLQLFVATALLATLAMSPAAAGIVYTLTPETVGPLTATGTITTDGNTGVLSAADITAFNITISGGGFVGTPIGFGYTGPGGVTTAFTATSTSLTFDFFGAIDNQLTFGGGGGGYELDSAHGFTLVNGSGGYTANGIVNFVLATASPAPGPTYGAGLPGLIFALGGLFFWFRRSQHASLDRSAAGSLMTA